MGERNEYEHSLAEDLVSLVLRHEFDRPAVVKPVCEFDQNYSHVVVKSQEDTFEVLGLHTLLLCLVFIIEYCLDLSKTFNQSSNLVAEQAAEVIDSIVCIFHYIMKQSSYYGLVSKSDITYYYLCDSDRVKYVWFA